jgi:regulator of protease activity HflC (stomatin/prohibitin superfamily)
MSKLMFGAVLVIIAVVLLAIARATKDSGKATGPLRIFGTLFGLLGALIALTSAMVVIDAGEVGVRHAFGQVDPQPLLPGIRFVSPWSSVERFSAREEQYPEGGDQVEEIAALSSEQMGMTIDVALRWQISPADAPRIYTELGSEDQIHQAVRNAIRNGVRDGMVQFTINDIAQRNRIATVMEAEVDSALVTNPRMATEQTAAGTSFRIARVTAFYLRDLQPPQQVIAAINNKIAQEQLIQTERHRVEVARLQAEPQRVLNQTLTAEALVKQYLEVLHDMRQSNNLVVLVPTEGGIPLMDLASLRRNLRAGGQ